MAQCFENPMFVTPFIKKLKDENETFQNKMIIIDIIENLMAGNEKILEAFSSPASDSYLTLLWMLMTKRAGKINSANQELLSERVHEFFLKIFDTRKPEILREIAS